MPRSPYQKTQRNIRIPDRLWLLAQARAEREYTNVSTVINRLLYEWVREEYPDESQPDKG